MIQTYNDIAQEIQNFRRKFGEYAQIQKIFSSSQFLSLQIRLPGKSFYLYFGRGHQFEGFWLGEKQIESALRKRDQFLEYFRRYLSASVLLNLDIDEKDRIIKIDYGRFGQTNRMFLFYKGRELYFANIYFDEKVKRFKTFYSWIKGTVDNEAVDYELFDEVGRKDIDKSTPAREVKCIDKLLKEEKEKAINQLSSGKSKKFLVRKRKNITNDITQVNRWPELQNFIQNNSDFDKLKRKEVINGFKISFKNSDHYKRQDELYTKVKKLKKAQRILSLRLSDTQDSLEKQKTQLNDFENKLKTIKPIWAQSFKSETTEVKTENGYKVFSLDSMKLGVGLTAAGNDQLRKNWGSKEDIWFHAHGDKSPHIVIKSDRSLDMEVFEVVAAAMVHFMGTDRSDINLLYCSVKSLKGVKGVQGSVTFKKEKYINVIVKNDWSTFLN